MRAILGFICIGLASPVVAQQRPIDIDPNTKIQGGADVRGSGANAGGGAQSDYKNESEPRIEQRGEVARPDKSGSEPEDASKGATRPAQ